MFGRIGLLEIAVIAAVLVVVIGPKNLPQAAKTLGRGITEFRRTTDELKETLDITDVFRTKK